MFFFVLFISTIKNTISQEFEARSCGGGQEFSAFGFISFLLIMMNFSANVVNNMNANSNDNNNNNNNNNDNNNNNNLVSYLVYPAII